MSDIENINWIKFYTSFQGRVNRKKYWLNFVLPVILLFVLATGITASVFGTEAATAVYGILSILMIWPKWALAAKRLHDRGYSGWWQLAPFGVFAIGFAIVALLGFLGLKPIAGILMIIVSIAAGIAAFCLAIQIGFLKGTDGPNRFGPDPLQPVSETGGTDGGDDLGDGAQDIKFERVGAGE